MKRLSLYICCALLFAGATLPADANAKKHKSQKPALTAEQKAYRDIERANKKAQKNSQQHNRHIERAANRIKQGNGGYQNYR